MYLSERSLAPVLGAPPLPSRTPADDPYDRRPTAPKPRVGPNVVFLGLTSLVTDVAAEMVRVVLPLYLTVSLGLTPLQFGAFDGMIQMVTVGTAVLGALAADRPARESTPGWYPPTESARRSCWFVPLSRRWSCGRALGAAAL